MPFLHESTGNHVARLHLVPSATSRLKARVGRKEGIKTQETGAVEGKCSLLLLFPALRIGIVTYQARRGEGGVATEVSLARPHRCVKARESPAFCVQQTNNNQQTRYSKQRTTRKQKYIHAYIRSRVRGESSKLAPVSRRCTAPLC